MSVCVCVLAHTVCVAQLHPFACVEPILVRRDLGVYLVLAFTASNGADAVLLHLARRRSP